MTPFVTGVRRSRYGREKRVAREREEVWDTKRGGSGRGRKRRTRWRVRRYYCWLKFFVAWVDLPRAPADCAISLRFLVAVRQPLAFFLPTLAIPPACRSCSLAFYCFLAVLISYVCTCVTRCVTDIQANINYSKAFTERNDFVI